MWNTELWEVARILGTVVIAYIAGAYSEYIRQTERRKKDATRKKQN